MLANQLQINIFYMDGFCFNCLLFTTNLIESTLGWYLLKFVGDIIDVVVPRDALQENKWREAV